MRRAARPVPFARTRLESIVRGIAHLPIAEWPKHLKMAHGILVDELTLQDEAARDILQSSLAAAHACAQRLDRKAQDVFQGGHRDNLHTIFVRMANCARRLPASARHALNRKIRTHLCQMPIDSESIETLIEGLITGFGKRPRTEPSVTVLRAVMPRAPSARILNKTDKGRLRRHVAEAAGLLKEDYAALSALDQRNVESALIALVEKRRDAFDTADVCRTVSRALAQIEIETGEIHPAAAGLITDYAKDVARIWQQCGLRPARATHPSDPTYRARFHRFADLVLTSVVEPWSKRHDGDQAQRMAKVRKAHAALPRDIRKGVRPALPRRDVEWLVADDHLKRALASVQKTTSKTP